MNRRAASQADDKVSRHRLRDVIFDDQEEEQVIFSARRRRLLLAPLFLALAFTTACTSSHGTAFTPSNDARKDFREALERLNTAFPYRLTENSSSTGTGTEISGGTRVAEFAAVDRFHVKWANGPLGNTEVITIEDKHYSKLDNGNWTEGLPSGFDALRQPMQKRMREMMPSAVKDAHYIGTDTINGVPCHTYTYTMEVDVSGQRWASTGKAWIGSNDGLPHQLDFEMTVSSYKQKSHVTYEYNVDFKVEKPVM